MKKLRIVFFGTPVFAVPTLEMVFKNHEVVLVVTNPDRKQGRGMHVLPSPVKARAQSLGLRVFQPEKLSDEKNISVFSALKPDLFIVVAYGNILKPRLLALSPLGVLNLHGSLLPRWRGAAPIEWAILSGDQQIGISTMQMVQKLDAGPIWDQEVVSLWDSAILEKKQPVGGEHRISQKSLHLLLAQKGAELVVRTIQKIQKGTTQPQKQNLSLVTYAPKILKDFLWLRWEESILRGLRQIAALSASGVKCLLPSGKILKCFQARVWKKGLSGFPSGNLFSIGKDQLGLSVKDGVVELLEVQEEGKKKVSGAIFLKNLLDKKTIFPWQLVQKKAF